MLSSATAVALVTCAAVLSVGVARADDYAGQTYADATSALAAAGLKGVVASRSGDAGSNDDCVVSSSEKAPWHKGDHFAPVTDTVLLNLTCGAGVASATKAGNSAASPAGRAAIQAAKQKALQQQQQQAAAQAKAMH